MLFITLFLLLTLAASASIFILMDKSIDQSVIDSKDAYTRDSEIIKFYNLEPDVEVTYDHSYGANNEFRGVTIIDEIKMSMSDIYSALTIEIEKNRDSHEIGNNAEAYVDLIDDNVVNLNLLDWINKDQLRNLTNLLDLDLIDGNINAIDQKIFLILARDDSDYFLQRMDQVG